MLKNSCMVETSYPYLVRENGFSMKMWRDLVRVNRIEIEEVTPDDWDRTVLYPMKEQCTQCTVEEQCKYIRRRNDDFFPSSGQKQNTDRSDDHEGTYIRRKEQWNCHQGRGGKWKHATSTEMIGVTRPLFRCLYIVVVPENDLVNLENPEKETGNLLWKKAGLHW